MFGHSFYHGALRKYIIMFGNMFNDLEVGRYDNSGQLIQSLQVPISYGPKEKFLARLREDPGLNKPFSTVLPRLSFEITNLSYDATRTYNKMNRILQTTSGGDILKTQHTPTPYDIDIVLYGMFANNEDAVQVVEQILPFFRPEWTHSVKITSDMNEYFDVPTVLNDMSIEDSYDSDFETRRAIIYTFNFTIKGYMFGPVTNKGVIKRSKITAIAIDDAVNDTYSKVTTTPGQKANGEPTSLSSLSVPISQIDANSNYGYAFDIENYFDIITRREEIGVDAAPEEIPPFFGETPFYSLSATPVTANEGDNVTGEAADDVVFTLQALNVPDRTRVPWTITGISSDDIVRSRTGYFVVLDQKAQVVIPVNKDFLTEATEYMTLTLDNGEANTTVTILDTSFDRKFYLSVVPNTSIQSYTSDTLNFSINTDNVEEGSAYKLVSDNFPVANGTFSNAAATTASGNNEFVIENGVSQISLNIYDDLRTTSGEVEAKFYIKNFDNSLNQANVSVAVQTALPAVLQVLSSDASFTSNTTQILDATNIRDGEEVTYTMLSEMFIPDDLFNLPATGTLTSNTQTQRITVDLAIDPNNLRDYLDRYIQLSYNFSYRSLSSNGEVAIDSVGALAQETQFINPLLPAGAAAYEVETSIANTQVLLEGYDSGTQANNRYNIAVSEFPTVNILSQSSILYIRHKGDEVLYISNNSNDVANSILSNSEIILNNGASAAQAGNNVIAFAPKETGSFFYWSAANNQTYGTINVTQGNNSVTLPITPG